MSMVTRGYLFIAAICAGAILLWAAPINVKAQYSYTTLSVPGATNTYAYGISGSNIVGTYNDGTNSYGFIYNINSNTYTTFNVPGAISTTAYGISGANITGNYGDGTNNYGFIYNIDTGAYITSIDPASPDVAFLFGIDGTNIVGEYRGSGGQQPPFGAFVYSGGQFTPLDVPGGQFASAYGIDDTNIVGAYADINGDNLGFLYNGSAYTTLSVPGTASVPAGTYAYGINGTNVVGIFWKAIYGYDLGFVYNINSGVYTTFSVPGTQSTDPHGISGNNIAGSYTSTNGVSYGFLATPLPLALQGVAVADQFQLTVSGPPAPAAIEASTNLVNWVSLYTNTPPFTFTDLAMTTFPARFYRVLLPH
jgi:hypothetical protein